jgi:hypothetical protein
LGQTLPCEKNAEKQKRTSLNEPVRFKYPTGAVTHVKEYRLAGNAQSEVVSFHDQVGQHFFAGFFYLGFGFRL